MTEASIIPQLWESAAADVPDHVVGPPSWMGHIPFAFWAMQNLRPRVFVELGSHTGVSYCAFCQTAQRYAVPAACFAVDNWQGDPHAGFYGEDVYQTLRAYHDPRYSGFSRMIRANFDDALPYFADGSIDLLHIDGYHTYDAVRHDFDVWLPKMSERGVVLFHDTNVRENDFGAWRLWDEVSERYPGFAFLHSNGLGVLAVGAQTPEPLRQLFAAAASEEGAAAVRGFFSRLGDAIVLRHQSDDLTERLKAAQREDGRLRDAILERNAEIGRLNGEIIARDTEIGRLNGEIVARDTEIGRLNGEIVARDAEVGRLNGEIVARDNEIGRLNGEIVARDNEIGRLNAEIKRLNDCVAEIERLNKNLAARNAEVGRLNNEIAARDDGIAQRDMEIVRLSEYISSIHASTSWRLTRPIRGVRRVISRIGKPSAPPLPPLPAAAAAGSPPAAALDPRPVLIIATHDCSRTGAPVVALELARSFARRQDVELHVVAKTGGVLETEFAACGVFWNLRARPDQSQSEADYFASLTARLAARPVKAAICNTVVTSDLVSILNAHGVPVLSLIHELPNSITTFFGVDTFRAIDRDASAVVFGSEFVRSRIIDAFHPTNRALRIAPTGYPEPAAISRATARAKVTAELGLPEDVFLVLGCGTMDHRKGVDLFVQTALRTVQALGPSCRFVWIGDGGGAYGSWCRHDLEAAGLGSAVHLIGSRESVDLYMAAADVFLMSSREDPFPLVTLGAIAAGVPVVAFAGGGGSEEVIGEEAGVTVPYLDVEAMSQAVVRLGREPALRRDLGEAGRRIFQERYTFDRFTDRLVDIMRNDLGVALPRSGALDEAAE